MHVQAMCGWLGVALVTCQTAKIPNRFNLPKSGSSDSYDVFLPTVFGLASLNDCASDDVYFFVSGNVSRALEAGGEVVRYVPG